MSNIIKGEVVHKGNIVPVEIEVKKGWLGYEAVVIHLPKEYSMDSLLHMVEFKGDLAKSVRSYNTDEIINKSNIGVKLFGHCDGFFGRGECEDKIIEAEGDDWILCRNSFKEVRVAQFKHGREKEEKIKEWSNLNNITV